MSKGRWTDYIGDADKGIDMGTGEVLDNVNWPELHEAKLLVQRMGAELGLTGAAQARLEGMMGFLDAAQDYAVDTLRVPGELVFLHRNPDHYTAVEPGLVTDEQREAQQRAESDWEHIGGPLLDSVEDRHKTVEEAGDELAGYYGLSPAFWESYVRQIIEDRGGEPPLT